MKTETFGDAPPSLEPCEELARLLALAFWKTHYKGDDEPMAHRLAAKQWNGQPFMAEAKAIITAGWRRAPSAEGRLREALEELVSAPALSEVRAIVAGWNGPPEKPYAPHPANLGASIRTTCGRVYKLSESLNKATAALRGEP